MENVVELLQNCSLFRDIPSRSVEKFILPQGTLRQIPKGKYLILPQERLDYFGVILRGKVHTMHIFPDGECSIIDALKPREIFGADLMCTKSRIAPYHAVAAEPVGMLYFPVTMVTEPGRLPEPERQQILTRLMTLLAHENMRKEYRLAILSRKGLRDRIMTYLTMQANKRHTASFTIPFSREEMASFLCVNRSALSHELSLMREEGLLDFRKNVFTLLQWEEVQVPKTAEFGGAT